MRGNIEVTRFSNVETEVVHRRLQSEVMVSLQGPFEDAKQAAMSYVDRYGHRFVRASTEKLVNGNCRLKLTFLDYEP